MTYKHYIRINDKAEVIAAFSNVFQAPQDGDILIADTDERHFNPSLQTLGGVYRFTWDGKAMVEKSAKEIGEVESKIRARADALSKLTELDRVVPRVVEDMIIAQGFKSHESVSKAIAEKQALRATL